MPPLQRSHKDWECVDPHFVANGADLSRIKNKGKGARFRDPVPIPIKQDQANRSIVLPKLEWLC